MNVTRHADSVELKLTLAELKLLTRALERASFIDTPVDEQADIAAFCARTLEVIAIEQGGATPRPPEPPSRSPK